MEITSPYQPRAHQLTAHHALSRFNVLVWHRRAGKTVFAVNQLLMDLCNCPHPNPRAAYIAPLYRQAKQVAWQYVKDFSGFIPGVTYNESELRCNLPNGAQLQLLGSENPDALRGLYLDSVVLDEVAQMAPRTWREVVRPALADRKGRAIMIGTPFGMGNQFYEFYRDAQDLPEWHRELLTWQDTDAIDPAEIEALRRELREEEFAQELECDWSAAVRGAYYGKQMAEAERSNRIRSVPHDPTLPVHTSWDLGIADSTVIWFWQVAGSEVRAIDLLEVQGTGLPEIIRTVAAKPYKLGKHFVPHDAKVRELGTGKSRLEIAQSLGMTWEVVPDHRLMDGIEALRTLIPRVWFDREKCFQGIEALKTYRTEWDDQKRVFKLSPLHSWESHFADSARYFAVGMGLGLATDWAPINYSNLDRMYV